MSGTPGRSNTTAAGPSSPGAPGGPRRPRRHRRRGLRIALISVASVLVLIAAVAAAGFALVNHLAGNVRRIPVSFAKLESARRTAGHSTTVLLTSDDTPGVNERGGLIMLLHINAGETSGAVVSIPPNTVVPTPGHGRTALWNSLQFGGPTLLVRTVEQVTGVPISHYARLDLSAVPSVVDAVGGVEVTLPQTTTSFGHTFPAGVNHLTGSTALLYARQPSLSEEGRVLRQQSLIRAILRKIAADDLLSRPLTAYRVTSALTSALTVDSNFTNAGLESLAVHLRALGSGAGTFVTAPTHRSASGQVVLDHQQSSQLWAAIAQDSVTDFAARYPATATPAAPR